jgi:hypothetical protein
MDLTQTLSQNSVAWLACSAIVAAIVAFVTSWFTYQFSQKKEKENRIREEIIKWTNPTLIAIKDLEARLHNILKHQAYPVLDKEYLQENHPNWSITYEFFMPSTLYIFAQYFAWVQLLVDEINYEIFQSENNKGEFFRCIDKVGSALGAYPHPEMKGCHSKDTQVFKLQQRAIGELLILRSSNNHPQIMTYTDFLSRYDVDETFIYQLAPLKALLEDLAPTPEHSCQWERLNLMYNSLGKLEMQCKILLNLKNVKNISKGENENIEY